MKYKKGDTILTNNHSFLVPDAKNSLFVIKQIQGDDYYVEQLHGTLKGNIEEIWIKGYAHNRNGANS